MKTAMQYGFPAIMAFISFWQPASIQIYLTCTSILSSTTATLLRNQKFRKATGLTLLPTKHAQELWTKVARNEIPLERVFKDGKLVPIELKPAYQPPSNPHASQIRGLNVKAGAAVPMHLRPGAVAADTQFQDRDHDYDDPPTGILNKIDWFGRNYKPKFLYMRLKLWMSRVSGREDVRRELLQRKKDIARKKAEEYEFRRRQRFTGRQ
jgi:YidC/Oxa1 family membrane protein insertase